MSTPRQYPVVPAPRFDVPAAEAARRAEAFADTMTLRRTVRDFSARPVPPDVIEQAVRAAATAPSGANLQPWRFVVITDAERKRRLRKAAEQEEREFYERRASQEWLDALAPLGTDW
ncbi:nitroreductase family protein, partial [Actinomadura sp. BRA 177]|uniref:nitroreductase family protein n=1 Tax=Actinomadura sp. BRA 177 TaxID=2745202 RepID=UPI001595E3D7